VDDSETFSLISSILKLRVTKFICLQQEYRQDGVTEDMWRRGQALRPYFNDVKAIVKSKEKYEVFKGHNIVSLDKLSFVHFPIRDCGITDDSGVLELAKSLVKAISEGEILYLHCWGGHGRTGTLVCIMLHLMYNLDPFQAMDRCQAVHDMREYPVDVGSPQTQQQRDQVIRIVKQLILKASAAPAMPIVQSQATQNSPPPKSFPPLQQSNKVTVLQNNENRCDGTSSENNSIDVTSVSICSEISISLHSAPAQMGNSSPSSSTYNSAKFTPNSPSLSDAIAANDSMHPSVRSAMEMGDSAYPQNIDIGEIGCDQELVGMSRHVEAATILGASENDPRVRTSSAISMDLDDAVPEGCGDIDQGQSRSGDLDACSDVMIRGSSFVTQTPKINQVVSASKSNGESYLSKLLGSKQKLTIEATRNATTDHQATHQFNNQQSNATSATTNHTYGGNFHNVHPPQGAAPSCSIANSGSGVMSNRSNNLRKLSASKGTVASGH